MMKLFDSVGLADDVTRAYVLEVVEGEPPAFPLERIDLWIERQAREQIRDDPGARPGAPGARAAGNPAIGIATARPIAPGARLELGAQVVAHGLSPGGGGFRLNDQCGVVVGFIPRSGRYRVRFDHDGTTSAIKQENLRELVFDPDTCVY